MLGGIFLKSANSSRRSDAKGGDIILVSGSGKSSIGGWGGDIKLLAGSGFGGKLVSEPTHILIISLMQAILNVICLCLKMIQEVTLGEVVVFLLRLVLHLVDTVLVAMLQYWQGPEIIIH